MSLKLSSSHHLSPSYWRRWSLEEGHIVLTCTSVEDTLVRYWVVEFLNLRDEVTVLIALPLSKCSALCSEASCYYLWTRHMCTRTHQLLRNSWLILCGGDAVVNHVQYQGWITPVDFSSRNQDSRRTIEVFNCSVYHREDGTRHFFQQASHIFWAKQDLPVSCPAL